MSKNKQGKILIAEPFMDDLNFAQAVVLICESTEEDGTIGFVLNKPVDMKVSELLPDFPDFDEDLYLGGPVGHDTVHYIHHCGDILDGSVMIEKGLYWGGDFDQLKFLIKNELITANQIKFFIGYSGWDGGQLDEELETGSWVVDDMDINYLLKVPDENLWKIAMQNKSDSLGIIAEIPDNLNLN